MRGQVFYSSKAGFEVRAVTSTKRRGEYEERYGKVRIRAFSMENGKEQIRVLLTPAEAYKLGKAIKETLKTTPEKGTTVIIHKTQREGKESVSKITVEYFRTKKGTEGIGIVVVRDKSRINVPLAKSEALYFADLLTYMAMEQSWFTARRIEKEAEEVIEETDVPMEDEFEEEEEDI